MDDISNILEKIIDEFEKFPPRVTDLLNYHRSREELTEILIRFLLSLDAYGEAAFAAQVDRMASEEERAVLEQLEEGGKPLPNDDRYMCARFVKQMCTKKPEYVPHFARLASIALLTEVVEDFVKPTQPATGVNLTVVLDGPVALDYLGCSGKQQREDVRAIIDALRGIGCSIVVYPMTIDEIRNNLATMLSKPHNKRYGATHQAMVSGEMMESYVQAVAKDPELALDKVKIPVRAIELDQFPNQQKWFGAERHEDFLGQVTWGNDVAAKEHDAAALALTMRLREGKHSSDLFRCRYVFVPAMPRSSECPVDIPFKAISSIKCKRVQSSICGSWQPLPGSARGSVPLGTTSRKRTCSPPVTACYVRAQRCKMPLQRSCRR
jgi:hypothetical protein